MQFESKITQWPAAAEIKRVVNFRLTDCVQNVSQKPECVAFPQLSCVQPALRPEQLLYLIRRLHLNSGWRGRETPKKLTTPSELRSECVQLRNAVVDSWFFHTWKEMTAWLGGTCTQLGRAGPVSAFRHEAEDCDYLLLWRRQIFSACWQWLYVTYSVFIITNSCLSSSWLLVRERAEGRSALFYQRSWVMGTIGLPYGFRFEEVFWIQKG